MNNFKWKLAGVLIWFFSGITLYVNLPTYPLLTYVAGVLVGSAVTTFVVLLLNLKEKQGR